MAARTRGCGLPTTDMHRLACLLCLLCLLLLAFACFACFACLLACPIRESPTDLLFSHVPSELFLPTNLSKTSLPTSIHYHSTSGLPHLYPVGRLPQKRALGHPLPSAGPVARTKKCTASNSFTTWDAQQIWAQHGTLTSHIQPPGDLGLQPPDRHGSLCVLISWVVFFSG